MLLRVWLIAFLIACCITSGSSWRRRRRRRRCPSHHCSWKWGDCSRPCGGGIQSPVITAPQGPCGQCNLPGPKKCNTHCCRVNCQWGSWGTRGKCSKTCGIGRRYRYRTYSPPASCGGSPCPGSSVTWGIAHCGGCCPVNCVWRSWGSWGSCTAGCGVGRRYRYRKQSRPAMCKGSCFGASSDSEICRDYRYCPVNCQWGSWQNSGPCTVTCGGGFLTRRRKTATPARLGGASCSGPTIDSVACNTQCCRVDCLWGSWGRFGACSATCGGGTQSRSRRISTRESCGGTPCSGPIIGNHACNTQCCPVDCRWGSWGNFGSCSATCGGGMESKTRGIVTEASCGGAACTGPDKNTRSCNDQCCPEDCRWGSWSEFSPCSVTCGGGTKDRFRSIDAETVCGGASCDGESIGSEPCNTDFCPVDCVWSEWSDAGGCSVTCGGGQKTQVRKIEDPAQHGGAPCQGNFRQNSTCSDNCCPVNCQWNDWSLWSECSKSCGRGLQMRDRTVQRNSSCGGLSCEGNSDEEEVCNDVCCPVHCQLSDWSEWERCSKPCGSGSQERRRNVTTASSCGGEDCSGNRTESQTCNAQCCSVDCEMSEWSEWRSCSTTCGANGISTRVRRIDIFPQCNGRECPVETEQSQPCNVRCLNGGSLIDRSCLCVDGWIGDCCDQDFDECSEGRNDCSPFASCQNTAGSYTCTCTEGYTGDGINCKKIDVCAANPQPCGANSVCVSTEESYFCQCNEGYEEDADKACVDVDECFEELSRCAPYASCQNTDGSYTCTCREGFTGDGFTCEENQKAEFD